MERYLYFIENSSARFLTVHGESIQMRIIRAELGQIEKIDSQQTLSKSEIDANLTMALQRGFQEVGELDFFAAQERFEQELPNEIVEPLDARFELIPWDQLAADTQPFFCNSPTEYLGPNLRNFSVCNTPYQSATSLVLGFDSNGATAQSSRRNLIFNNGLTIDGNLDAGSMTTELPLFLLVKGDLNVHNLMLSGWAEVVVTGNVIVTGSVIGLDGEAGGRLNVHGNLSAINILGGYMYDLKICGKVDGKVFWLDQDEPSLDGASIVPTELSQVQHEQLSAHTPLVAEAYSVDSNWASGEEVITYNFDAWQAFELVRRGGSLFLS